MKSFRGLHDFYPFIFVFPREPLVITIVLPLTRSREEAANFSVKGAPPQALFFFVPISLIVSSTALKCRQFGCSFLGKAPAIPPVIPRTIAPHMADNMPSASAQSSAPRACKCATNANALSVNKYTQFERELN